MTTGSITWTIRGWTSLVLSLGSTVSFVTLFNSTTGGGNLSHHMKHDSVLFPRFGFGSTILIVALGVVLHGSLRTVSLDVISVIVAIEADNLDMRWVATSGTQLCSNRFYGSQELELEILLVREVEL
ncbi:hypothetical protein Tco_1430092 [Tanacetum coccineum]